MTKIFTHGIEHFSPSALNQFAASPASFLLQRVMKRVSNFGPAAHRGTAVENGVAAGLDNLAMPVAECVRMAIDEFNKKTALSPGDKTDKERAGIPGMVEVALGELRKYGKPTSTQGFVQHRHPDLAIPIVGYYDFEWAHHSIIVDLKTTHAVPSAIKLPHARQVSLYKVERGIKDPRILYTSSKKCAPYSLENAETHLQSLVNIAKVAQKFLSISEDPMELASLVAPDLDNFYLSDPLTRQAVWDVWKI